MHRRFLVVVAFALAAAAFGASPALANHSWNGYHWARTSNPFTLKVGDNVTASWDSNLALALSDWSKSTVLDMTADAGQAKGKNCRPTSGRVEVCNNTYGYNGWLGIAQIWISGGTHITQGSVRVNDTYFNLPQYNDPTKKSHVMCQEVGHTLGLDHQDESGADLNTCMDYADALDNPHPNQHDYEQLEAIYAHLDSFTTVGGAAGSLPDAVPSFSPASRVSRSKYVDDLGNGMKLVTYVHWASPFAF